MADFVELAAAAQILRARAEDLGRVRTVLKTNAEVARWHCAKADRYRSAVDARGLDMIRVQGLMAELASSLSITSAILAVEQQSAQPAIDNTK
jgi:hypothetical protein